MVFRLRAGDQGPQQQSRVTCGAASLVVSRMLASPEFAASLLAVPDGRAERFAAAERDVHRRTNALIGPGGFLQLPWPRALGTPPWGARRELEAGAAARGSRYRNRWVRPSARRVAEGLTRLADSVGDGTPGLVFVGNRWLPRHVVLVIGSAFEIGAAEITRTLTVYEPSSGRVLNVPVADLVDRRTALAGWAFTWAVIAPIGAPSDP